MARGGNASGRDRAAVTMVAAAVLLLTGCNADPTPVVTETPSVSPTPVVSATPSPTPTLSVLSSEELLSLLPPEAAALDERGATATAAFYVALLGDIFVSLDTAVWSSLSTAECAYCRSQVDNVAELGSSGWTAEGGAVEVDVEAANVEVGSDGFFYVTVVADIEDLYAVNADGTRELVEAASTSTFRLQMTALDRVWRVNGMRVEERA